MGFPDKLGFKELVDLIANHGVPFGVEPAAILNDRLMGWVDIEFMIMAEGSMLDMSLWDHANTSLCYLRKSTSWSQRLLGSCDPI